MSFFIAAAVILFALTCGVVFLSYTIIWYEAANRNPELMRDRFAMKNLAFAGKLMAVEIFWLFATVLAHPFGWLPERKNPSAQGTPVLLLHGLFHNRACWWLFKKRLQRAGIGPIYAINLSSWRDIETLTEKVAKKIDQIRFKHNLERIDVVGHSMGGLIARNYIQLRGGSQKVRSCATIGSPHEGSRLAPFALTPLGQQLIPGSDFLMRLEKAEKISQVRFACVYSIHDNLIIPSDSARWNGAVNTEIGGSGHCSMLYRKEPFVAVRDFLQEGFYGKSENQQPSAG